MWHSQAGLGFLVSPFSIPSPVLPRCDSTYLQLQELSVEVILYLSALNFIKCFVIHGLETGDYE